MNAKEAIDRLDAAKWQKTSAEEKLDFLKQIRKNLSRHMDELAKSDCDMKNKLIGDNLYNYKEGLVATVVPVGSTISACIDLYKSLVIGRMPEPISIKKVGDELFDVHVFPKSAKDKVMCGDRRDYLRVKGEPKQINPLDKPGGIIGVLGAGNYSSSIEMITALFLENCAVVHKPHHLNEDTDKIWVKIKQPLVEFKALSFCSSDEGRNLVKDKRLMKIYFTGGFKTAQAIMSSTDTEFISECGGNNPCIVVPGDKPWIKNRFNIRQCRLPL